MVAFDSKVPTIEIYDYISVETAATYSGYSQQYLRRLLRGGRLLASIKVGQVWLIDKKSFDAYLKKASKSQDRRFCSKSIKNLPTPIP